MHRKPRNPAAIHNKPLRIPPRQEAPPDPNKFTKKILDANTTIYLGSTKNYIHYKDNQMGFGGMSIKIQLTDGTTETVVGPYFCPPEMVKDCLKIDN